MKTPYFLISEEKLNANVDAFNKALKEIWPYSELAYSVKTNSLPWILDYLQKCGVMAEVVSDEEYMLAKMCGYSDDRIIYNGPIKGERQFSLALSEGALINLDSKKDIEYLEKFSSGCGENIGIRINVDSHIFEQKDIGYGEEGFRFGFSEEIGDFLKVLKVHRSIYGECRVGLHLHCNSVTRSINVYKNIANYASKLIKKYNLTLSYIDMGGGYFGGIEGKPTPNEYINVIKEALSGVINPEETKLIVEPGSAIIGSVVDLHTSVLDVKDTMQARIVTTDGSRIHLDPLWKKSGYMYSINAVSNDTFLGKQVICGYTCMDHDRIMVLKNEKELNCGDEIIYHRVGAYTMTFGGMFIRYLPDVYVEKGSNFFKVRNSISVKDYYKIQNFR